MGGSDSGTTDSQVLSSFSSKLMGESESISMSVSDVPVPCTSTDNGYHSTAVSIPLIAKLVMGVPIPDFLLFLSFDMC